MKKKIPIVVDREPGLKKAIRTILPDCAILTCWNHLRGDFKYWLTQNKVPSENISLYLHQLKQMLHCESEEAFLELSDDLTSKWAAEVGYL
jgi:transposase-like protein